MFGNKKNESRVPSRKPRLVAVAGCAASGKTTIARILAKTMGATYIDKDDATRRFTDLVLTLNGYSPQDRESDFYIENIRDTEYDVMFSTARGNLEIGNDVVVSAPFLNVIDDVSKWTEMRYPVTNDAYEVILVWIEHDVNLEHKRMVDRSAIRDGNKLENWDEYVSSVEGLSPDPAYNAIIISNPDNSSPMATAAKLFEMLRTYNSQTPIR